MERSSLEDLRRRHDAFLAAPSSERTFVHRFTHERSEVDLCICRSTVHGPLELLWLNLRYGFLLFVLALPWSTPKVWALRLLGARVGKRTYISQRAYIDPMYPQLLEVGDDVLIGYDAKIFFHEITQEAWRVGRVTLEDRCIVGASAILRPGIVVGAGAEVGALSAVTHNVAPGATVFGVPARVVGRGFKAADDGK